jgi:hypothetical protein
MLFVKAYMTIFTVFLKNGDNEKAWILVHLQELRLGTFYEPYYGESIANNVV